MLNLSLHTSYRLGLKLDGCAPLEEPLSLTDHTPFKVDRTLVPTPATNGAVASRHKPAATIASSEAKTEPKKDGGAAGTMERGFKQAGSSIQGFFTGKKKKE